MAASQLSLFEPPPADPEVSEAPAPAPQPAPPPAAERPRGGPAGRPAPDAADRLAARLDPLLDGRLRRITLTANRTRILSGRPDRRDPDGLVVRIDRAFVDAPDEELEAVARWLLDGDPGPRGRRLITERFEAARRRRAESGELQRRRTQLEPLGRTFDLDELAAAINRDHFGGELEVAITWGQNGGTACHRRRGRRARSRSIRLGSYSYDTGVIRIHPVLDHPSVPRLVVESVIHHEMLHQALPLERDAAGRRRLHTPRFRRLERAFPGYRPARRWIDRNLESLLERR